MTSRAELLYEKRMGGADVCDKNLNTKLTSVSGNYTRRVGQD